MKFFDTSKTWRFHQRLSQDKKESLCNAVVFAGPLALQKQPNPLKTQLIAIAIMIKTSYFLGAARSAAPRK
jgi:hypothetical protein